MKTTYLILFCILSAAAMAQPNSAAYPDAPYANVLDTIWDSLVPDSFRLLESTNAQTEQWLQKENQLSIDYFKDFKYKKDFEYDFIHKASFYNNIPRRSGPYYIQFGYDAFGVNVYYKKYLRDRSAFLYKASLLSGKAKDISEVQFSPSGDYCALEYSVEGSEWKEIRILNMKNELLLKDHLYNVCYSSISWFQSGFFIPELTQSTRSINTQTY